MNSAHWHMLLNHLPVVFPIVGIMVFVYSLLIKSELVQRVSFLIFIVGAIFAYVGMLTGEQAEEFVEHLSGFDGKIIHNHEEAAEVFATLSYILGLAALASWWLSWKQNSYARYFGYLTLLMALICMYFAWQTGISGGEIRHTEIRSGAVIPQSNGQESDD